MELSSGVESKLRSLEILHIIFPLKRMSNARSIFASRIQVALCIDEAKYSLLHALSHNLPIDAVGVDTTKIKFKVVCRPGVGEKRERRGGGALSPMFPLNCNRLPEDRSEFEFRHVRDRYAER